MITINNYFELNSNLIRFSQKYKTKEELLPIIKLIIFILNTNVGTTEARYTLNFYVKIKKKLYLLLELTNFSTLTLDPYELVCEQLHLLLIQHKKYREHRITFFEICILRHLEITNYKKLMITGDHLILILNEFTNKTIFPWIYKKFVNTFYFYYILDFYINTWVPLRNLQQLVLLQLLIVFLILVTKVIILKIFLMIFY